MAVDEAYAKYAIDPSPENLTGVIKDLEPTINYALGSVNAHSDPLARSKAYVFTADAIRKYSPDKAGSASLPTYVSSQLQQMHRAMRQARNPVHIPERAQLDAFKLNQAQKSYIDQFGREPDAGELADFVGIPVKRIEKVRNYQVAVPTEGAVGDLAQEGPDLDREALEYIYHDADHTDRRILEHKTGYGGAPVLLPKDLAIKLKLTPVQLTRRSMRLTKRINEVRQALEKTVI